MNEWILNECMNTQMNEQTKEFMNERIHERVNEQMNEEMNLWMNRLMNECVNACVCIHVNAPRKLNAHTVMFIQCSDQQPRFGKHKKTQKFQELVSSSHRTVGLARLHLAINSGSGDMWRILPESPSEKWCKKPGEKKRWPNMETTKTWWGDERDFFSNGKYGTVGVEQNANNAQFSWGGIPLMQSQWHLIRSVKLNDSVKVWFLVIWVCCWKISLLIAMCVYWCSC